MLNLSDWKYRAAAVAAAAAFAHPLGGGIAFDVEDDVLGCRRGQAHAMSSLWWWSHGWMEHVASPSQMGQQSRRGASHSQWRFKSAQVYTESPLLQTCSPFHSY